MGSSAQNSPGVHRCRRRVRFNEVPEKLPKVPEKVWEALVQSQVRFDRVLGMVPGKIPEKVEKPAVLVKFNKFPEKVGEKVPEKVWEALVQSQVSRVPEKVLEKVPERKLWRRARSGSTGFRRRSRRMFGRLWCRARLGSTGFRRRFR